jgi:hypothetical protein
VLQVIFGDDEHTAADGPYVRLMKTRKWIYLTSAASLLLAHQYVDAKALHDLIKIVDVPPHYIGIALTVALTYLTFQYSMIFAQLLSVYDIVLTERFRFRREDELAAARSRVSNGEKKLREISREIADHPDMKSLRANDEKLENEEKLLRFGLSTGTIMALYENTDEERLGAAETVKLTKFKLDSISKERDGLQAKMSQRIDELNTENMYSEAMSDVREAQETYHVISDQNPADRSTYRYVEGIIDLVRILPPLLLAFSTIFVLYSAIPDLSLLTVKENETEIARKLKAIQANGRSKSLDARGEKGSMPTK